MHVDASAIVAILVGEAEREDLIQKMAEDTAHSTSIVSAFEAVVAVGRKTGNRSQAVGRVREFLDRGRVVVEEAGDSLLDDLAATHVKYGKGSGSPARLNLGDCFSYALAKRAGAPLLYKGDDFDHTDLAG